jgi:hypothetical protein
LEAIEVAGRQVGFKLVKTMDSEIVYLFIKKGKKKERDSFI